MQGKYIVLVSVFRAFRQPSEMIVQGFIILLDRMNSEHAGDFPIEIVDAKHQS